MEKRLNKKQDTRNNNQTNSNIQIKKFKQFDY